MDLGLRDRVAIIGGSSRGIGKAVALAFAQEGASVTISARTETDLRRTEIELARISSQHHVLAIPADLSSARDTRRVVRDTINRYGHVSVLVNHVWEGPEGRPSEFHDDVIISSLEQNFVSAVRLTREVIPYMKQQRWGRIIHLFPSQVQRPVAGSPLSSSSQIALMGFSRMLATELAGFNITVNNVIAGPVETEFLTSSIEAEAEKQQRTAEEITHDATDLIPMRRFGKPEEIGSLIAFLASDRAAYMTGANVVIDGGMLQAAL